MKACNILIVTAVIREFDAVSSIFESEIQESINGIVICRIRLLREDAYLALIGMGCEKARRSMKKIMEQINPATVISVGFSGGTRSDLKNGAIVVPDELAFFDRQEKPFFPSQQLVQTVVQGFREKSIDVYRGKTVTVKEPVIIPAEKKRMHDAYGYLAVDMEAAVVAEEAQKGGASFLCVRIILDEMKDSIIVGPAAICSGGKLSPWKIGKFVLFHPRKAAEVIRFIISLNNAEKMMKRALKIVMS